MGITRIALVNDRGAESVRFSVKGSQDAVTEYSGVTVKKAVAWELADEIVQSIGKLVAVRGSKKNGTNRVDIFVQN